MFKYSFDNKRYHTLNYYFRQKFQAKVAKVSLNADFTCPNRDGTVATGGCIFCSAQGSGDFAGKAQDSLVTQFNEIKQVMINKWQTTKFVGYFQAYSNTYADLKTLEKYYDTILAQEGVVGLHIATRADCLSDEIIELLVKYNEKTDLWVELGLQSSNDETAKFLNRGHTYVVFCDSVKRLRRAGIKVCVHIINGLINENYEQMIKTVTDLNELGIDGLKIHMLHIIKNTSLAKMHEKYNYQLLTREEYVKIVCDQLELLNEKVVIFRLTGDAGADLITPSWTIKKLCVLNEIDKELKKRNSYQGSRL